MRMDKYNEKENTNQEDNTQVLSREKKNQEMYDELYMNNKVVDINQIINEENTPLEEKETPQEEELEVYEEKNYSIDDYLKKAHEKLVDDKAMRNLDNQEFQEQENEIIKLIQSIDQKEEDDDFFKDLRGDNEDTMIGMGAKTDEFDTLIYETLKEDNNLEKGDPSLDKALTFDTVASLEKQYEEQMDRTFERIIEYDEKRAKKSKKLSIIVFSVTLFMLIMVIIIVILFH